MITRYNTLKDNSYTTVRAGFVASYRGVRIAQHGGRWIAERGLGPLGTPTSVREHGRIQRISSDADPRFWSAVARWLWHDGAAPASALQVHGEKARRLVESALAKRAQLRKSAAEVV